MKRKRVEVLRPPPGIKKARALFRKKRRNKLRGLLAKPQLKYVDQTVAATEANYDSVVQSTLNGMAVGDTDITRDGQQIVMNSLQIKGILRNTDNTAPGPFVRYIIVLDRYPNETNIALSSVYDSSSAASDIYALKARGGSAPDRFKIMLDQVVHLGDESGNADADVACKYFSHFIRLADIAQFNDHGTGNADDFQKGCITLFCLSDVASASTGPTIEFKSRVTYFDQ
jgi:hypothetical protein